MAWFAYEDTDTLTAVLRDGWSLTLDEHLRRFQQQVESAGSLPAFLNSWWPGDERWTGASVGSGEAGPVGPGETSRVRTQASRACVACRTRRPMLPAAAP